MLASRAVACSCVQMLPPSRSQLVGQQPANLSGPQWTLAVAFLCGLKPGRANKKREGSGGLLGGFWLASNCPIELQGAQVGAEKEPTRTFAAPLDVRSLAPPTSEVATMFATRDIKTRSFAVALRSVAVPRFSRQLSMLVDAAVYGGAASEALQWRSSRRFMETSDSAMVNLGWGAAMNSRWVRCWSVGFVNWVELVCLFCEVATFVEFNIAMLLWR
jgi:hypothetical protein